MNKLVIESPTDISQEALSEVRVCIDKTLPGYMLPEAAARSIQENALNLPGIEYRPDLETPPVTPLDLVLLTSTLWANGRTLRVSFMGGEPSMHQKVEKYAKVWSDYANIQFEFGNDPNAEIRVAFMQGAGSWSYLGAQALSIPKNQPTMNFGWLTPSTPDNEYSRVVTHEFGHALGCGHEHASPSGNIPWNVEAVYRYYMGPPNNWPKEQVDSNVLRKYSATITNFSAFDRKSIMLYAIPSTLTLGGFEVDWNHVLSDTDKQFIAEIYPKSNTGGATTLTIGGDFAEAAIGAHGEIDHYQFTASAAGEHTIETAGPTDVVMTLLGPNNQTDIIATDDDSGKDYNAKITARLKPGTYYLRVQHYWPDKTGSYKISVRQGA